MAEAPLSNYKFSTFSSNGKIFKRITYFIRAMLGEYHFLSKFVANLPLKKHMKIIGTHVFRSSPVSFVPQETRMSGAASSLFAGAHSGGAGGRTSQHA